MVALFGIRFPRAATSFLGYAARIRRSEEGKEALGKDGVHVCWGGWGGWVEGAQ